MHIVHHNTKYLDLFDALKYEDGTTVIGIVFKVRRFVCCYFFFVFLNLD